MMYYEPGRKKPYHVLSHTPVNALHSEITFIRNTGKRPMRTRRIVHIDTLKEK